jgi:hypothetical protein
VTPYTKVRRKLWNFADERVWAWFITCNRCHQSFWRADHKTAVKCAFFHGTIELAKEEKVLGDWNASARR